MEHDISVKSADTAAGQRGASGSAVAVVIATVGRPQEVGHLLERLSRQTAPPSSIILSVGSDADLPPSVPPEVVVLQGPKGLPAQRNRGLDVLASTGCDVVVFYDDDFVPALNSVELFGRVFAENPGIAGVTGRVIADGIGTAGISEEDAVRLVDADQDSARSDAGVDRDVEGLYGCNMAFRHSAIADTRFDERLPLYAWQEDTDFSRRLLDKGRLVQSRAIAGVHRGVKGARNSGVRFGWSQIVNPIYLIRKGSVPLGFGARLIFKNLAANHLKMFWPEPWVDRWGRVKGNWRAIGYIVSGKLDPSDMAKLL